MSLHDRFIKALSWNEFTEDPRTIYAMCALAFYFVPSFTELINVAVHSLSDDSIASLSDFPLIGLPNFISRYRLSNLHTRYLLSVLAVSSPVVIYLAITRKIYWAASLTLILAVARFYFYSLSILHTTAYTTFFFIFLSIVLFLPHKIFCLRWAIVLIYFLSGLHKLSPSWVFGDYFLSVPRGLPLLPDNPLIIQFACCGVIVLEAVGAWFLISQSRWHKPVLWAFFAFHVYSIFLVGVAYPLLMIPMLLVIFCNPVAVSERLPDRRVKWALSAFVMPLIFISQYYLLIDGSSALTQEGKLASLFMFDANKGCRISLDLQFAGENIRVRQSLGFKDGIRWSGETKGQTQWREFSAERRTEGGDGPELLRLDRDGILRREGRAIFDSTFICDPTKRQCCDPYLFYLYVSHLRKTERVERVGLQMFVSLNGSTYWHKLVDDFDFDPSKLEYTFLRHNDWIRLPDPSAPLIYRWF